MKNLVVKLLVCLLWAFAAVSANAQYLSLHQYPQAYVKSQFVDGSGTLVATKVTYTGFKDQFAPVGTTGCTMGVASLRSECVIVSDGLSFSLAGAQQLGLFKVYVPAGTTRFVFSGYLPQGYDAAVVVKASSGPTRTSPLTDAEYANYRSTQDVYGVFSKLQAGEEVVLVHNGGGSFSLAGNNTLPSPLSTGVWLYFRQINGTYVDTPRATYEIDLPTYIAGYNSTTFGGDGDPVGGGSSGASVPSTDTTLTLSPTALTVGSGATSKISTNAPTACTASLPNLVSVYYDTVSLVAGQTVSTRTPVTITCGTATSVLIVQPAAVQSVPLTSITLSQSSLVSNDQTTVITVTPNAGANLSGCKAIDPGVPGVLPAFTSPYVVWNASGTSFHLNAEAGQNITTAKRVTTIDCGSGAATALLTIDVPLLITDQVAADGSLNLVFSLKPSTFTSPTAARVWVLGYVPKNPLFGLLTEMYLYKTESGIWDVLHQSLNFDQLVFKHIDSLQSTQDITITTGVRKSDLALLGAQVHVFYQVGDNPIQYLAKVFPH